MIAIILAAGDGQRVHSITRGMPKCLVEIGGRPSLDYLLDWLRPIVSEIRLVIKPSHYEFFELYELDCNLYCKDTRGEAESAYYGMQDLRHQKVPVLIALGKTIPVGDRSMCFRDRIVGSTKNIIATYTVSPISNKTLIHLQSKQNGYVPSSTKIHRFMEVRGDFTYRGPGMCRAGLDYINRSDILFKYIERVIKYNRKEAGEYRLTSAYELMLRNYIDFDTMEIDKHAINDPQSIEEARKYFENNQSAA